MMMRSPPPWPPRSGFELGESDGIFLENTTRRDFLRRRPHTSFGWGCFRGGGSGVALKSLKSGRM
jgi:hypothetical protein